MGYSGLALRQHVEGASVITELEALRVLERGWFPLQQQSPALASRLCVVLQRQIPEAV